MSTINKKGFTLIETLLSLAIFSIAVFVISAFYFESITARVKGQTLIDVETEAQQALMYMTQAIRNSESISSPTQGNNGSNLSLIVPDIGSSPTIFSLSGGMITVSEGATTPVYLTSSSTITVTNLMFENLSRDNSPGTVKVSFTASHVNETGRNEYEYSETYYTSATLRPQ